VPDKKPEKTIECSIIPYYKVIDGILFIEELAVIGKCY